MNKRAFLLSLPFVALATAFSPVLRADSPSLKIIKFEADWCGPCQQMKPAFAAVSKSESGVAFQTVDVDKQGALAEQYKVNGLPTVVAVKNGRVVGRLVGLQNEAKLKSFVKKHR